MIVSGKETAETLYRALLLERAIFPGPVTLGILIGDRNPVTASYVRIKERAAERLHVKIVRREIPEDATTAEAIAAVRALALETDGVIPQLPMTGVDSVTVCNAVPQEKDVDVLSDAAFGAFEQGVSPALPPVAAALAYIVDRHGIAIECARVVVVGQGRLVGKPASLLFAQRGADVVSLVKGDDVAAATRTADIVIMGTGVAGLLTPTMVKEGAVVLDAGTSESGGRVVGDASPAVAEKCALFTPVPGGVGPIAIAMIFKNLFALKRVYG